MIPFRDRHQHVKPATLAVKAGDRVRIVRLANQDDEANYYPVGLEGTVERISNPDSVENWQAWTRWDNGGTVAILPQDEVEVL